MLPGGAEALKQVDMGKQEKEFKRMEGDDLRDDAAGAQKPANPQRQAAGSRIAKGSGVSVTELNTMLNKFGQMQQMMKKMGKFQKMMARMGGGLPGMLRR